MRKHLLTIVGKRITILPQMLDHYLSFELDSLQIWVHLQYRGDPLLEKVEEILERRGLKVAGTRIGDWLDVQYDLLDTVRRRNPHDWFLLADQDELQVYPQKIDELISHCEARGYNCIRGLFLDRFSRDGRFPSVDPARDLWSQFPIGASFTYPILNGNPRKVVATKGPIEFTNSGHHDVVGGNPMPVSDCLAQVHHFKWVEGLLSYLDERTSCRKNDAPAVEREKQRLIRYLANHGDRIDLDDPKILAALCGERYPHWEILVRRLVEFENVLNEHAIEMSWTKE